MSFIDFGEEQLTQPPLDMPEPQDLNRITLMALIHELSWSIGEVGFATNGRPITIYIGGDAAAVFTGVKHRSAMGLCIFAANPTDLHTISLVKRSSEISNTLAQHLADSKLQDWMDAVPQIAQRLVADAASIEPIYSCPNLKVIIPRWEIPYAIKIHELALDSYDSRPLKLIPKFLRWYLLATTPEPLRDYILESSVQGHVRAVHPEATTYAPVSRSVFDKVNRRCRNRFNFEPILFEG